MQHSTTICIHHKQCAWLLQYVRKHLASGYTAKSAIALPARKSRSPLIAEVMSNTAAQDVDRPISSDMPADEQAGPSNRFASLPDALRIPPLSYLLGNRVEHLVVEEDGLASDLIHANLGIDKALIQRLIWFGAVHHSSVPPLPSRDPGSVPAETIRRIQALRDKAQKRWGKSSQVQTPRRLLEDKHVEGGYFRIHLHPKRFPAAHRADWAQRIVRDTPDWVAVNKPAGLQVPPTVDNVRESLLACTEQALGLPYGLLLPPHRLDAGTEGVVVLAKSTAVARRLKELFDHKGVSGLRKRYRCLVHRPPPLGTLEDWVVEDVRVPGLPAHSLIVPPDTASCHRCELQVVGVEEVALSGEAQTVWGDYAYEVDILLVTGRTHQIRIQLAHRGFPLLGDLLYQAVYAAPESDQQSQEAPSSPATFAAAAASGVEQAEPAQLLEEARPIKHPRMHPWQPASSVDMLQAGSSAQADSTREVACQGSFVVQVGQHAPLQTHIPLTPASCAPNEGGGARSAAAGLSPLAAKDRSLEAQRIFREHQDNPLKPVALQAYCMEFDYPFRSTSVDADATAVMQPLVLDAGIPWWRA